LVRLLDSLLTHEEPEWRSEFPFLVLSPRTPAWLFFVAAVGTGSLLAVLLVTTLTRQWPKIAAKSKLTTGPTDNRHLTAFAIFYIVPTAVYLLDPLPGPKILWSVLSYASALLALAWMWIRGSFRDTLRADWGLHWGRSFFLEAAWGLLGFFVVWCIRKTTSMSFGRLGIEHTCYAMVLPWWVWPLFLYRAVIHAPVVEEAFFRGALYRELRRSLRWFGATLVVALVFTVSHTHYHSWVGVLNLLIHGFVYCALRELRGSLVAPMVMHAAGNGLPQFLRFVGLPLYLS
jgi:membrane protease YdiL (CAAX protease family)